MMAHVGLKPRGISRFQRAYGYDIALHVFN